MAHLPVLLNEVIEYLNPKPNENFIDATLGDGGHAKEILKRAGPGGKLLGIDRDINSINAAKENLKEFGERVIFTQGNFSELKNIIIDAPGFGKVSGILADLGLSSAQIESSGRGFSFDSDEPIIMSQTWPMAEGQKTAMEIVNKCREEELSKIFHEYGEERLARAIAQRIVKARKEKSITTARELADIAFGAYKKFLGGRKWNIHPATRIFMALRIAVNNEMENLESFLPQAVGGLSDKGRIAVISFHSLEDRIVKNFFRRESRNCICPPEEIECSCAHIKTLKIITKKPVTASLDEINSNPRSRSAKLRVAEKIEAEFE